FRGNGFPFPLIKKLNFTPAKSCICYLNPRMLNLLALFNINTKISQIQILILCLIILVSSCELSDNENSFINSPSGQFKIKATVNRTDNKKRDFGEVIIQIVDKSN